MLQKYERKAEDILEKLAQEEPNERNFEMMANALIVLGGGKIMGAMGGESYHYDGGRMDEYVRGRGRYANRDSRGRYAYDGRPMMDGERDYWDDGRDIDRRYYDGRDGRRDGSPRRDGRTDGDR